MWNVPFRCFRGILRWNQHCTGKFTETVLIMPYNGTFSMPCVVGKKSVRRTFLYTNILFEKTPQLRQYKESATKCGYGVLRDTTWTWSFCLMELCCHSLAMKQTTSPAARISDNSQLPQWFYLPVWVSLEIVDVDICFGYQASW